MKTAKIFFRLRSLALLVVALPLAAMAAGTSLPGVGNFEKIDDHVYRGAQPTEQGFESLAKLGIRTVIDLQEAGSPRGLAEAKAVQGAGMEYINVPMEGMKTPSNDSITKALAILENANSGPVFVHCHRGADRTGGVIACYRVEHDHWSNSAALSEARSMGMSWYQTAIQRYVRKYTPKPDSLASDSTNSVHNAVEPVTPAATVTVQ